MSESIHAQRAKRWFLSPFACEWLANAVDFCKKDVKGKQLFESWVIQTYGPVEGRIKLRQCQRPVGNLVYVRGIASALDQDAGLDRPAAELGVPPEALHLYHQFTSEENHVIPKQTKPAIRRRRGESAIDWLARRQGEHWISTLFDYVEHNPLVFMMKDSFMNGGRIPNWDLNAARAVALSEFDVARDTIEIWHTNPEVFCQAITRRSESYIPSKECLSWEPEHLRLHLMHDAFRALYRGLTLSHMVWYFAVELFEDLARRGLATTSAIERAYERDSELMWRLVACFTKVWHYNHHLWGKLAEILAYSEHFRPYFIRSRGDNGASQIIPNATYIASHPLRDIEDIVVRSACDMNRYRGGFFSAICDTFRTNPSQVKKFSSEAFDAMGDVAITHEFYCQAVDSAFGQKLKDRASAIGSAQSLHEPYFLSQVTFMDPKKAIPQEERRGEDWGYAKTLMNSLGYTWLGIVSQITLKPLGQTREQMENISPTQFDAMWKSVDNTLWHASILFDKSGQKGVSAKHFGLFNPNDPLRPTYGKYLFSFLDPANTRRLLTDTLAASSPITPISPRITPFPKDTFAQSGHSYIAESKDTEARQTQKVKSRGAPGFGLQEPSVQATAKQLDDTEDDSEYLDFPDVLPSEFKLGKKVMKVFHRILDSGDEDEGERKKGQVRWGDFEKAMKRIGFAVCQTAGSSVRFDPPARTARPITFHRPHPDPILSPNLIKLVGARLKRCYGWTVSTFTQGQGDD